MMMMMMMMMPSKLQSLRVPVLVLAFLCLTDGIDIQRPKSKRQIYREQVLPSRGGKIPDGAFRTDRLALNRLNKEGIAIPDGVLLEHRLVHSHPHINKHDPEDEAAVIQIVQKEENRFVAAPGKYHHRSPPTIPSTYIIRKPIGPETTVLRTPPQQTPHQLFPHNFPTNKGYVPNRPGYHRQNFLPQIPHHLPQVTPSPHKFSHLYTPVTYNPVEVPSKKYLPTGPGRQKYLPTAFSLPDSKLLPLGYSPTVVRHPHPHGYEAPISYQSVSYYPIHAPLVLPNKELQTNEYYRVKGNGDHDVQSSDVNSKDIHDAIDWTALLAHYSRVSNKLESLSQQSYEGSARSQTKFVAPEVLGPMDSDANYYAENVGRYVRKSEESEPATDSKEAPKLRCNSGEGNAVEDGSTPCPP